MFHHIFQSLKQGIAIYVGHFVIDGRANYWKDRKKLYIFTYASNLISYDKFN